MKLVMVNPFSVKKIKELDENSPQKTDDKDPKAKAKLVIDGRFSVPYMPEGIYAEIRDLEYGRDRIIKQHNISANRIQRWLKETIRLAKKLRGNLVEFYIATPLPGTELYNILKNDNSLTLVDRTFGLNQKKVTTPTYYVSEKRLFELRRKAIRSIYLNPLFYLNSLRYINSLVQLKNCIVFMSRKIGKIVFDISIGINKKSEMVDKNDL